MSEASEEELRARLEAHGYRVDLRQDAWCECWIRDGRESWTGRGEDRARAFEAALSAMLPSRLARTLWRGASNTPSGSQELGPADEERAPLTRPGAGRAPSRSEAVQQLDFITRRIEALGAELGVFAPERQRLAMLSWMCEARTHTQRYPADDGITDKVSTISRLLTELGKRYWPGSVTALQLAIEPTSLPRGQLGGTAETWAEAAGLARRSLVHLEAADLERGLDGWGWAEDQSPPPAQPESLLDEVVDQLIARSGPLERGAEPERERSAPDPEAFARWTHRLRWARPWTHRPQLWGQAFGRLRWWSSRRQSGLGSAAQGLEPDFLPPGGWSVLVGAPFHATWPKPPEEQARAILLATSRRDPRLIDALEQAGHSVRAHLVDPESAVWEQSLDGVDGVVAAFGLALAPVEMALEAAAAAAGRPLVRVAAPEVRPMLDAAVALPHPGAR